MAVHIRRGDMVYRNFYEQLSPDAYYVNTRHPSLSRTPTSSSPQTPTEYYLSPTLTLTM